MQELLLKVARAGIRVELDGDELKVMGPAHALTPDLREALQTHKSVLIERFRQMQSKKYDAALPEFVAAPQARAEPFPLTDVQHAYWMGRHKLVELGQVATHFYFELDCVDLDHDRLNTALCRLIERHDMLRAVVDSNGLQRILPDVPRYQIAVQDLSVATSAAAEGAIVATREAMSLDVLPADQWPLFDVRATCLKDGHSRLHVSLDMLTMDAWSMFVLFQEWHQLYENLHQPLPAIDISYRDYILTERRLLGGAAHERARCYWEERLDTLPGAPELPILGTTKTEEPPRFSRRRVRIDKARWLTLKARARNEGLTPSGLLLAVYAEVLTRWSSSAHYTLNLTLFNRLPVHPQVSRLIGDFTSLTMLEVDHRNYNSSFRQRAAALQRRLMDDLEHSEYSGVQVLREWSQRQRAGMHAAMPVVFTSALVLGSEEEGQDASLVERFGPMVYGLSQTPQVWLDNQVMEIAGDLVFNWDAVDAMFEPGVLDAMFDAHHALLIQLADDEAAWDRGQLVNLPQSMLATRSEQVEPLVERVLHAGLFEFAQRTPDAPALISSERTLTYRMLLAESTNVAHWLQTQGLRPGELVGVVMHKGWQQMVGVLGILQAGGAYMPVDASLPPQRQHELLQLGQVRCVLTQAGGLPLAPEFAVQEIVALAVSDDDLPPLTSAQVQPADLAYVIFTSGTTGQPKGVMITHQAAYNTILHINAMLDLRAEDRILAVSSLSFDLSVYDLFGAIDVGAALVLPAAGRHLDALHWRDLIEQHQVSIWNSAPQLMRMLVDSVIDVDAGNTHLRAVLLSGDWIPVDLPSRLRALYPDAVVISLGGATEASIWSISYQIDAVDPGWSSIPYGKALPNQSMLVLNARFESSPDFVRGGIYIGGAGLAEGYWADAERTAQRFITHPESGARLYDTGDMGHYLPDGNIEFLGRNDDQVKIRGHRVEPGEVAAVLRQHPEVQEAVVLATGIKQNRQLAAYVQMADTPIQELGYRHAVAAPAPLTSLLSARLAATDVRELDADLQSTWARLDDYYLSAVMTALRSFGITGAPGEVLTVQDLLARGVAPRYRRWLGRAFDELGSAGLVGEVAAEVFEISAPWETIDLPAFSGEIQQRLQQALNFSEQEARWFTQAVEQLRDILTEHLHSAEIYTADATAQIYQKLFPDNHQQLSLVIDALLEQRGGSLSVLEIGAGLGSATQHVLPGLMASGCHYTFTDISEFFLNRAQQLFGDQSGSIEFACYNVDIRPEFQGFQRNGFDLVLASSMLHDVCDIHSALNNIRGLLKPGGQLVLLEETRFFPSFDLHMGLQQGFDGFTDTNLRSRHCLLTAEQWRHALDDACFSDVLVVNAPGTAIDYLGFHVIVATGPLQVTTLDTGATRRYLAERLPDYMVPQHIVLMEEFPVTANGKLDYKALPAVPDLPETTFLNHVAPRNELERTMVKIWADVMRRDGLGVTDNFFDVGGDSLIATQIVREINQQVPATLEIHEFLYNPTIEALSELLSVRGAQRSYNISALIPPAEKTFPSLNEDVHSMVSDVSQLIASLPPLTASASASTLYAASKILLTGATGWVGTYLLRELLTSTGADVICLVRSNDLDGVARITGNFERYGLPLSAADKARIIPLTAQLGKYQCGLPDSEWQRLCETVDYIFHVAASVDTIADYQTMRNANVLPIPEMIRLAQHGRIKPIVFTSSQAVCIRKLDGRFTVYPPEVVTDSPEGLMIGYAQSKWAAERILMAAAPQVPVSIVRIPHVLPASNCPATQDNILSCVLEVARSVGTVPEWPDSCVDGVPVDRLARLIVSDANRHRDGHAVAHVVDRTAPTFSEIVRAALVVSGIPAPALVPLDEWLDQCRQLMRDRHHHSDIVTARLFELTDAGVLFVTMFGGQRVSSDYFSDPAVDQQLLSNMVGDDYWVAYCEQSV